MLLLGDLQHDERFQRLAARTDVKAAVSAPVTIAGDVAGVINVNIVDREATFTEADAEFLGTLANNAAIAIQNARLYAQVEEAFREIQKTQERLSALFESAYDAIFIVDGHTHRVDSVNARAVELTGFSREELLRKEDRDLNPSDDVPGLPEAVAEALATGSAFVGESQLATRLGDAAPVDISATRIDADGAPLVQAFVRDVSERKRLQARLGRAEQMKVVGQMASGVAHEFNNRFAGILGNAQLLLRDLQDERQQRLLAMIEESALAGTETVRKMQEFTRLRANTDLEFFDVREVVGRTLRSFVEDGLVEMQRHRIVVRDAQALAREAEA